MKRVVIYGAGQGGRILQKLLQNQYVIVAFCDADKSKWNRLKVTIPVVSPKEALLLNPDFIWISIMNEEECGRIKEILKKEGFQGEVRTLQTLKEDYDIRLAQLRLLADFLKTNQIGGDVAELGVFKGDFAMEINREFPDRRIYLFDTFSGFDEQDLVREAEKGRSLHHAEDYSDTSEELVLSKLPFPEKAVICKGIFPETIPEKNLMFSFVSIDADLFAPTYAGLEYFYPRMNRGGIIMVHDFESTQYPGVGEAVKKYCKENNLFWMPVCDLHGSAVILKV